MFLQLFYIFYEILMDSSGKDVESPSLAHDGAISKTS